MIDFEGSYTSSNPCRSGDGSYFSRLRSRAHSGHIHQPAFVGLGSTAPNMDDPLSVARDIWKRANDQNTDPRVKWYNRQPLLMDVGRICLRGRHEDGVRTTAGHRFELLGSIVVAGEWQSSYDDLNLLTTRFDSAGLGELRLRGANMRGLHPALATATVQTWGGYPAALLDASPIQYGLESKSQPRSTVSVYFAMRGDEHIVSLSDVMAEETVSPPTSPDSGDKPPF